MARKMLADDKTSKWFKSVTNEPKWLKGVNTPHDRVRLLQIPSLNAWYSFMHEAKVEEGTRDASITGSSWAGTADWDSYIKLLDEGDEKVMGKIKTETKNQVRELEKRYEKEIKGYKFDVSGEFFDIGLVLSGIPEAWLEPDYEEREIPRVVMRIDMGFTAGVRSDTVINNGAKLLGMAKVLEDMGVEVQVELYGFQSRWRHGTKNAKQETLITSLTAKGFNEPINYKKLSSLLTTAHFRRGIFRVMEVIGGKEVGGGYGNQDAVDGFVRIREKIEVDRLEREIFGGLKDGKI
jgi:hypothetical protein